VLRPLLIVLLGGEVALLATSLGKIGSSRHAATPGESAVALFHGMVR
jgi:hypothetical protein